MLHFTSASSACCQRLLKTALINELELELGLKLELELERRLDLDLALALASCTQRVLSNWQLATGKLASWAVGVGSWVLGILWAAPVSNRSPLSGLSRLVACR